MIVSALKTLFSGLIVGSSMTIPGVSGGTMAIILGIYNRLIRSVSSITTKEGFKKNIGFLLTFLVGSGAGIYLLSGLVLKAIEAFKAPMLFLFIGIIAGTVPTLFKETKAKSIKIMDIVLVIVGFGICLLIALIPNELIKFDGGFSLLNLLIIVVAGFVIAIALVLPGISCSQMLLLLGILDMTYEAIHTRNFAFLIPLALSVGVGTLLTTSVLEKLMANRPRGTYFLIIGFVIGSIIEIYQDMPKISGISILFCALMFIAGVIVITLFSKFAQKFLIEEK